MTIDRETLREIDLEIKASLQPEVKELERLLDMAVEALERIAGSGPGAIAAYRRRPTSPDDGRCGIAYTMVSARRMARDALAAIEKARA